ncbi:hypothetical protein [Undibacterium terreum]|uniref:Uncharacterized protein n=1 Tax=Undibacterium terreum TaxID=1224302 RepID=A0A916UTW2_9BURK|nr:hypothetical protein [Undibacterium terreum]GGC84761.1 hypothetical protein GCM10011396_35100 [Undibacterium terreum]
MNVGENKGRRLRLAIARFAAILIEEARDLTGFTFSQLDEYLGLPDGQSYRYSLYPISGKTRSPQAAGIQQLEDRVAALLKRCSHKLVVENNRKLNPDILLSDDHVEGSPNDGLNLRGYDATDFQIGYEGDWPTYRRLKYDRSSFDACLGISDILKSGEFELLPEMIRIYAWQWGILWNKGIPGVSHLEAGIDLKIPIELYLPALVEQAKNERAFIAQAVQTQEGRGSFESFQSRMALLERGMIQRGLAMK